jgi:fluoroquinolone resistance protein
MPNYITDQNFEKQDFNLRTLAIAEYENCKFIDCNFSNSSLDGLKFLNCQFIACNLSLVSIVKTTFNDVIFNDCKMLGLRFENCNDFGLSFSLENCKLNHSSFYKLKLKNSTFKNSQLQEVDFTESDFSNSSFLNCDFLYATFDRTILDKVDFKTAINFVIDPEKNRIKKAKFSKLSLAGLLTKYDITITE